jgi:hypothetical protein
MNGDVGIKGVLIDKDEEVACLIWLEMLILIKENPEEDLVRLVGFLMLKICLNPWS